ncbi:MAG: deoxyuridine 5'-triphosphate nucleotidohydrolase [Erysipelotrichales bacterium]|nr:deoxyuridine 5'-triphosphate nucleotidohydrolase [Erysipelotrichales bacterium]
MRKFEVCRGFESIGVILPERKTEKSAGYDIRIVEDISIEPGETITAKTGIKALMQEDEVLFLYLRSSIGLKFNLFIPNSVGVIDADYYGNADNDGHIMVTLHNFGKQVVTFQKHERVAQGIFTKFLKVSDEKPVLDKRLGGYGSTGK